MTKLNQLFLSAFICLHCASIVWKHYAHITLSSEQQTYYYNPTVPKCSFSLESTAA